jgi:hypothetical protein
MASFASHFDPLVGSRECASRGSSCLRFLGGCWVSLAIAMGCATTELAPTAPNTDGAAVARTSSVEVRAQVRPPHPDVPSSLTQIEISVKNLTPGVISVALDDIELVAPESRTPAILAESIQLRRPIGLGIDPASPFAASSTASSASATGGVDRASSGPVFEPSETYALGADADPRRRELVDAAFRGGSLDRGETERGVIYFDTESIAGDRVNLRVLVRAGSDRGVTQVLEIPFTVQS